MLPLGAGMLPRRVVQPGSEAIDIGCAPTKVSGATRILPELVVVLNGETETVLAIPQLAQVERQCAPQDGAEITLLASARGNILDRRQRLPVILRVDAKMLARANVPAPIFNG